MGGFRNILVVVKQTPYEHYLQLKAQGKAPVALRWKRLKNRYETHSLCVKSVEEVLQYSGVSYNVIGREEMHRGSFAGKDLVIAVGGDGTVMNASSFLDNRIPVLGVNSDPSHPMESQSKKPVDERRSRGALCAATATNVQTVLPIMLTGEITPGIRTRLRCTVRSTHTETRLPPSLNDILVAHPIPAAVSRFRVTLFEKGEGSENTFSAPPLIDSDPDEGSSLFSFNIWSSGMWICTATGSTAAMHAAGGSPMELRSKELQYLVREPLMDVNDPKIMDLTKGIIDDKHKLVMRWNSQEGQVYVDGSHMKHNLELGDELTFDNNAPEINMFDPII
mmetsp:Transcript_40504/g.41335  ORF Transcript_40504/g.41335 Transcript_40504/m.41335 type:complete len:335 (+) Transcript_40504:265-1269(+)|eukprot:CAMPEP_0182428728 /NCGR_PEP_ID=MMETSP1167-20130531/23236_1 /TAXON_ID=2988 /ORGANISM="Mallomonas Sp, Strain CCMP3275" /LENGTH=334 /DNA_ID=CAMNT_0024611775 /DNA_START=190 /DNA_END=1194 /DNA_ORIENTATION=-